MLHTLRKKSKHTRMMITVGIALFLTLIIAAFWIWSSSGRFAQSRETIQNDAKPFRVLVDLFGSVFGDFKSLREDFRITESDTLHDGDIYTDSDTGTDEQLFEMPDILDSADVTIIEDVPTTDLEGDDLIVEDQ